MTKALTVEEGARDYAGELRALAERESSFEPWFSSMDADLCREAADQFERLKSATYPLEEAHGHLQAWEAHDEEAPEYVKAALEQIENALELLRTKGMAVGPLAEIEHLTKERSSLVAAISDLCAVADPDKSAEILCKHGLVALGSAQAEEGNGSKS